MQSMIKTCWNKLFEFGVIEWSFLLILWTYYFFFVKVFIFIFYHINLLKNSPPSILHVNNNLQIKEISLFFFSSSSLYLLLKRQLFTIFSWKFPQLGNSVQIVIYVVWPVAPGDFLPILYFLLIFQIPFRT